MPKDGRKEKVTPIFKGGKKEDPGNYRPIRLTSTPGKGMEQLILETVSRHRTDNKSIRSSQNGSSKGKSCLTDLINFYVKGGDTSALLSASEGSMVSGSGLLSTRQTWTYKEH